MNWWQATIVVLLTLIVTKTVDLIVSIFTEKREFNKYRREKDFNEIEELKNKIGKIYELAANWKAYDAKKKHYIESLENDHELIGKYNKYPSIANTARDTIHWCGIVAFCEREQSKDLIQNKKELGEKFKLFLEACDNYIKKMI